MSHKVNTVIQVTLRFHRFVPLIKHDNNLTYSFSLFVFMKFSIVFTRIYILHCLSITNVLDYFTVTMKSITDLKNKLIMMKFDVKDEKIFNAKSLSKPTILNKIKILNDKAENITLNKTILKRKNLPVNCSFFILYRPNKFKYSKSKNH